MYLSCTVHTVWPCAHRSVLSLGLPLAVSPLLQRRGGEPPAALEGTCGKYIARKPEDRTITRSASVSRRRRLSTLDRWREASLAACLSFPRPSCPPSHHWCLAEQAGLLSPPLKLEVSLIWSLHSRSQSPPPLPTSRTAAGVILFLRTVVRADSAIVKQMISLSCWNNPNLFQWKGPH